ncbi:hypothetical protein [Telluribacter sp.]|jgi:hypothetical protein|uniref:hypothetical protein n=1 Tax=Telluribacter sp. TaxID=1978767 RepID=UPI002E156EFB|nr:hypothetical protein [Telluribacter sp.]
MWQEGGSGVDYIRVANANRTPPRLQIGVSGGYLKRYPDRATMVTWANSAAGTGFLFFWEIKVGTFLSGVVGLL